MSSHNSDVRLFDEILELRRDMERLNNRVMELEAEIRESQRPVNNMVRNSNYLGRDSILDTLDSDDSRRWSRLPQSVKSGTAPFRY
jgi:hypothetical protein